MALWPNGRYMTRSTYKGFGVAPGLDANIKARGDRMNRFVNASFARTASTPDGYDVNGTVPAIRAGSMSALRPIAAMAEGATNLLQGGPMEGTAGVANLIGDSGLSLVVGMEGAAAVATLTGDNLVLKLTIGLDGSGSITLTGDGNSLAMIVQFDGSGSLAQVSGTSDLRGLLSMAGEWTPFTELSPEGLANAVWNSLVTQYGEAGTMGNALGLASAGGVDYSTLAAAVLSAAQITPIHANVQAGQSGIADAVWSKTLP